MRLAAFKARSTMKRLILTPSFAAAFSILVFSSSLSRINIPLLFPVFGLRARETPGDILRLGGLDFPLLRWPVAWIIERFPRGKRGENASRQSRFSDCSRYDSPISIIY